MKSDIRRKILKFFLKMVLVLFIFGLMFYIATYSYFTRNAPKHYTGLLKYLWGLNWEITKCDMIEEEYDGKYVKFRYLIRKGIKEKIRENWHVDEFYINLKGLEATTLIVLRPIYCYREAKKFGKDLDLEKLKYDVFEDTTDVDIYTNSKGTSFIRKPYIKGVNYNDITFRYYYALSPDKSFVVEMDGFPMEEDHNVIWDRIKVFWYNLHPQGICAGSGFPDSRCYVKVKFENVRKFKCSMLSFRKMIETFEFKKSNLFKPDYIKK